VNHSADAPNVTGSWHYDVRKLKGRCGQKFKYEKSIEYSSASTAEECLCR